jgi:hypothetical protein
MKVRVVDEGQHTPMACAHPRLVDVRSEAGIVIGYQCSKCPATWAHCDACGTPNDDRHRTRTGCIRCGWGKFCNVKTRMCYRCAPADDGVCLACRMPFPRTGRQVLAKKIFCGRACQRRWRRRPRPANENELA